MNRNSCALLSLSLCLLLACTTTTLAKRQVPPGGRVAVVVDERLSALRATPNLSGILLRRVSRGGLVAITGTKLSREGVTFHRVNVTRRTSGWIQRDAIVAPSRAGDDVRLAQIDQGFRGFRSHCARANLSRLLPALATSSRSADDLRAGSGRGRFASIS